MEVPESAVPVGRALPAADDRWAICCSGGGIRSASYCLGALQALEQFRFLDKARLIMGVSGGSYIAASRALVAHGLGFGAGSASPSGPPAYAPGSPEEKHLRDDTRYLATGLQMVPAVVLTLLLDVAVTMVLFLTPLFAAAHALGWVLRSQGILTLLRSGRSQQWTATLTGVTWWIWPAIAAGVTFIIFMWWRATLVPGIRGPEGRSRLAVSAVNLAAVTTLGLATAMLAVPALMSWLSGPHSGALKTVLANLGYGSGAAWTPAAVAGVVIAVVAISQSAQNYLAKYNLASVTDAQAVNGQPGLSGTLAGFFRGLLLPWLASVLVLVALGVAGLRWVKDGAAAGCTEGQVVLVLGALAVMLVMRFVTEINRISVHNLDRWRLASAYSVIRDTSRQDGGPLPFGTKDYPGALLSQLREQRPELILCTTANINARREVPPGRGGLSFTFDPDYATLRGPYLGGPYLTESVQARTSDYEALVGPRRFTLFDVSAISGAAFPPMMGSATRKAYRILFAATDLRLGIWLPHPAVVRAAEQELNRQTVPGYRADRWWHAVWLLLWYMVPRPGWRHSDQEPGGREARLWAYVLKLRRNGTRSRQFLGGVLYRGLQPTLGMLCAEAAGHASYRATWMCVTDGGQYDNLGLVEALHRAPAQGITHILVLDASGDKADNWSTLGEAIALARSAAAVDIELDPTTMVRGGRDLAPGQVVRPWAHGRVHGQSQPGPGDIWVCKLAWWTGAPWDVVAYARQHPSFPFGSSPEQSQLYDATEFDAYRELGAAAIVDVAKHWSTASEQASALQSRLPSARFT